MTALLALQVLTNLAGAPPGPGLPTGRMIYYSWGTREPVGDTFRSWTSGARLVVVCRRAADADGSWHLERRDPFADYRRAFNRAPHPIVAVGVAADTDMLHARTVAEVADLGWEAGGRP